MRARQTMIVTLGSVVGLGLLFLNPVQSKLLNLAFLACLMGIWTGFARLVWKHKLGRLVALALPSFALIPLILPASEIHGEELRFDSVRRLAAYEGVKYRWGGESGRGIDCSGLPRRALRDALLEYGIKHFNGTAFRVYLEHWWFDASAKALGEGYRRYTANLGTTGTIEQMDFGGLSPGDLAVPTDGVHVLVYAGDDQWIQADPGLGVVATLDGRLDDSEWFRLPVTTHRWQLFLND